MKIYLLFIIASLAFGCTAKTSEKKPPFEAKQVWEKLPEPLLSKLPDSFKQWVPIWEQVFMNDQKYRTVGKFSLGKNKKQHAEQLRLDSINQNIVSIFINRYGYPGPMQVGIKGVQTIQIVIQHGSIDYQEKFYPVLIEAYKEKKVAGPALAMLEDRMNVRRNHYQVYGTQLVQYKGDPTLYPVLNIDSLNTYREAMGLVPIEIYLPMLKAEWNPVEYKKLLPVLTKGYKIIDTFVLRHR